MRQTISNAIGRTASGVKTTLDSSPSNKNMIQIIYSTVIIAWAEKGASDHS